MLTKEGLLEIVKNDYVCHGCGVELTNEASKYGDFYFCPVCIEKVNDVIPPFCSDNRKRNQDYETGWKSEKIKVFLES